MRTPDDNHARARRDTIAPMSSPAPPDLATLLTIGDLEQAAAAALSPMALRYYRSGADAEHTLLENQAAFARWVLYYRVLCDVSTRDLGTTVLGTRVAAPILILTK